MLGFRNTMRTWFLGIACASVNTLFVGVANSQVIPDGTLPNNSDVKVEGNINKIEGGTTAGSNLFHSFKEFSVPTGKEAHFNNAVDISNIITRVTGKSISDIDGLIKANGSANLFLINPSGIVFGENARLDIGGSFVGSTADSFKFADGEEFSATKPQEAPLLTVNVPLGLQYGANPGNIQVQGDGQGIRTPFDPIVDTQTSLRVQPNQTLALLGGDVSLEGATLTTAGGRIELGSVAAPGLVNLTPTQKGFSLGYDAVENGGNIELSEQTAVDASGEGAGDIQVWGKNIKLSDGSVIEASTLGSKNGGSLVVNAQKSVEVIGTSNSQLASGLFASVYSEATGNGGDLSINAQKLLVRDGAQVGSGTFGKGKGGNLTVYAEDIQLIGTSNNGEAASGLSAQAVSDSTGDAGDLKINTNTLHVKEGAQVSASTFGGGKGGNLTVYAEDIQLIGTSNNGDASGLSAQANPDSTGDAGDLNINTDTLLVQDGAQVSAGTFGGGKGGNLTVYAEDVQLIGESKNGKLGSGLFTQVDSGSTGDAGDLKINTDTLLVQDGAQVNAGTVGGGKGGNLTVYAEDVQVIGESNNGEAPSGLFASAQPDSTGDAGDLTIKTSALVVHGAQVSAGTVGKGKGGNLTVYAEDVQLTGRSKDGQFRSGLGTSAEPSSTGDAGDLRINTDILQLENGAAVSVAGLSEGTAGNLIIDADSIRLNNDAVLTANTRGNQVDPSTEQATININSQDLIMRRGSNILTNARGENVIGGNINIDTDILVALENSDISANSENSSGGNVRIESQGIFGTQFRPELTPQSDITATGVNQDSSGTVEIITPDTDTNSGLVNLPTIPVETEVAQACADGSPLAQSRFEITGLNGLPPNPSEALTADAVLVDLVTLKPEVNKRSTATVSTELNTSKPKKIVEATGFSTNKKGEIFLVADGSNGTHHSEWNKNTGCRSLN